MEKKIANAIMMGVKDLSRTNGLWGYIAEKKIYRADCICHLVHLPFNFKKW